MGVRNAKLNSTQASCLALSCLAWVEVQVPICRLNPQALHVQQMYKDVQGNVDETHWNSLQSLSLGP